MRARERGSVTVELALALPAVALLLVAVLVLGSAAVGQLRCADAARAGARAAALGEEPAQIAATARRVAGPGAAVGVDLNGEWVTVTVSRGVVAGPFSSAPLRAQASAVARVEP
ncbi:TadE family type IV pilus minor pilin [Pengzhenrongella frigida]|uniref:Pilus assembly protein TadE n=1 Tax=Pengzhenrongella frigida TaxID=1259133 RepID=A0A4Q5MV48_9MICO|nr:TadE family type IV pilus minor pilin [Cellulomonas sp. HLT2-17]RYV49380.1 pilus assembly protein TadE [Cellulomonas sp. HLT2-17]